MTVAELLEFIFLLCYNNVTQFTKRASDSTKEHTQGNKATQSGTSKSE